jgi:hypothetical protein
VLLAQNFFGPQEETGRYDGGRGQLLRGDGAGGFDIVPPLESGVLLSGDMTSAPVGDLDGDARPDVLVARNSETPVVLSADAGEGFAVRLDGGKGNPAGVGAQVRYRSGDNLQTAEIHAGSGYLGASAPTLFFTSAPDSPAGKLTVRWPSGETTEHPVPKNGSTTTLSR